MLVSIPRPARVSLVYALIALVACPLFAVKPKDTPPPAPEIPVELVPSFLQGDDLRAWREAQRDLEEAEADIESGQWLANKQISPFVSQAKVEQDHAEGKALMESGQQRAEDAKQRMATLQTKAAHAREEYQAKFAGRTVSFDAPAMPLDRALEKPTESLLFDLWNAGYNRIYFGGARVLDAPLYTESAPLAESIQAALRRYDGNRYTLAEAEGQFFTLGTQRERPVIMFPDRPSVISSFKPVLLVAEVVYEAQAPYGLYALHAFDLKTGELLALSPMVFPVDAQARALLGRRSDTTPPEKSTATNETSETKLPATDANEASPEATLTANADPAPKTEPAPDVKADHGLALALADDNNFLNRLADAGGRYTFAIDYVGEVDGYDHRAAVLLNKAMLKAEGLTVSDWTFLSLALDPNASIETPNTANVTWRVSPTQPVEFGQGWFNTQAITVNNEREVVVEVGQLSVEPASVSIPPQAATGGQ